MFKVILTSIFLSFLFIGCSVKEDKIEKNELKTRENVFVNGKNGVIIDIEKNVAYYVFKEDKLYFDAYTMCENLVLDGLNNWDLPTYEELGSLVNMANSVVKSYNLFDDIDGKMYWSSKKSHLGDSFRILIDFKDGETRHDHIFNQNGVICKSKIKLK